MKLKKVGYFILNTLAIFNGLALIHTYYGDTSASYYRQVLEFGDRACEMHGGFQSSDLQGNFTCANGFVLTLPNTQSKETTGESK